MKYRELTKIEKRNELRNTYFELKNNLENPEELAKLRIKYNLEDEIEYKKALLIVRYILTEEEYDKYLREVMFFMFGTKKSVEHPRAIFVVGQPGAGKSLLDEIAYKDLDHNAIIDDYDLVRSFHPNYELASKEAQDAVHIALMTDADWVNEDIIEYAKKNHYNFISEGTMRRKVFFINTVNDFKENGYDTQIYLMAVPELESYGSTIERYAYMLEHNKKSRWISFDVHSECYDKLIETLKALKDLDLYDRVKVYRRGNNKEENYLPQLIYDTEYGISKKALEDKLFVRENSKSKDIDEVDVIEKARKFYQKDALDNYSKKMEYVDRIFSKINSPRKYELADWKKLYAKTKDEYESIKELENSQKLK